MSLAHILIQNLDLYPHFSVSQKKKRFKKIQIKFIFSKKKKKKMIRLFK